MQAQLNIVLGLRRSSSLVSRAYAGSISPKKVYRYFCKGLFDSGVTAEMIKSKPPNATTSSQIDVSTNADQLPEGNKFSDSETSPLPTISTESNQNQLKFVRVLPPVDFLVGPLMLKAAEAGYTRCLKSILGFVRNINFMDDTTGATALHKAASGGYNDIVQLLLTNGASIEAVDKYNETPLYFAARKGHTHTVELLLSKSASIEATDDNNHTPLHCAASNGHTSIVELLLSKGASIEAVRKTDYSPLHFAASNGHTTTVELLLSKGASIQAAGEFNYTPLHSAASHGHNSTIELLLSKGASIEATDREGDTPLHLAAMFSGTSTVKLLLSEGASIEARNTYYRTPLQHATLRFGNPLVLKLLERAEATTPKKHTKPYLDRCGGNRYVQYWAERNID